MADEKEDDGFTERLDFKISIETKRYLLAIKKRKMHGNTTTAVVRRFIDDGIRLAIKDGFIAITDGEAQSQE